MQKIRLITVGKVKTPWIAEGCSVFIDRLKHSCKLESIVLNAGTADDENKRLTASLDKCIGQIILLDETGKEMSSVELSAFVGKYRDLGDELTFVIGGAYGFDQTVKKRATVTLSLSRMTFPHELCQLIFLEQLYRAHSILAGSGYHH